MCAQGNLKVEIKQLVSENKLAKFVANLITILKMYMILPDVKVKGKTFHTISNIKKV
jgi:hypothetical protein